MFVFIAAGSWDVYWCALLLSIAAVGTLLDHEISLVLCIVSLVHGVAAFCITSCIFSPWRR